MASSRGPLVLLTLACVCLWCMCAHECAWYVFVCLHETQHSAEGDTGQCPCISLGSRAAWVLRDLSPNLGSCPLSCRGGTSGRGVVGETCPAEAAVSQTHPGLVSELAGDRGVAAFPGPAWASLHSSPAERLGLAEPGVSCLSQPRLRPPCT